MSSDVQIDNIVRNPIFYNAAHFPKLGYGIGTKVACDRCEKKGLEMYVSNPETPETDLCIDCYNKLKLPSISAPSNIVWRSSASGSPSSTTHFSSTRGPISHGTIAK